MPRNRNRRLRLNTTQNSVMFKLTVCVLTLVAYGFFFVWQNVQCVQTGENICILEKKLKKLGKANDLLALRITRLKAPFNIQKSIEEKNLQLVAARENQIVKLR
ncbi:MAG: hypothetical protein KAS46_08470 [Candidatus Aureabacteria bacterium]|nr:hypothetical protein [Candidatus Auribacterota bacterium]